MRTRLQQGTDAQKRVCLVIHMCIWMCLYPGRCAFLYVYLCLFIGCLYVYLCIFAFMLTYVGMHFSLCILVYMYNLCVFLLVHVYMGSMHTQTQQFLCGDHGRKEEQMVMCRAEGGWLGTQTSYVRHLRAEFCACFFKEFKRS